MPNNINNDNFFFRNSWYWFTGEIFFLEEEENILSTSKT